MQLDPRIIQPFLGDCRDTIAKLDNHNMKSIKGLEDRLYALDQMIASCKKLVNEQKELAQVVGRPPPPPQLPWIRVKERPLVFPRRDFWPIRSERRT